MVEFVASDRWQLDFHDRQIEENFHKEKKWTNSWNETIRTEE